MRKPSELFAVAAGVWEKEVAVVEDAMRDAAGRGLFRYTAECAGVPEMEGVARVFSHAGYVVEWKISSDGAWYKVSISW